MEYLKQMLKELSEADGLSGVYDAVAIAESYLSKYAVVRREGNNLIGEIKGKTDYTVMLDAHIDEIGLVVTSVNNGFLKVSNVGGIDRRMLAGMKVTVHGKEKVRGVFCSTPPHLDKSDNVKNIEDMYIDTGLGDKASDLVSVGDRITFEQSFESLMGTKVTGKALDNRAGCVALIRCAELLKGKELPCNVLILLSDAEEIGGMGAKTKAFANFPDEAVAVDVSFGNAPDIESEKTGTLGDGAMLGISPLLSKCVTDGLKNAAQNGGYKFQYEVMGGKTGTNADHIALTRSGVKTGLLSIPLRNMHTPVEVVDIADVESVANILAEYIFAKQSV